MSGIAHFHAPPQAVWTALVPLARRLPAWPSPGSIVLQSDVLIVRLGK